MFNKRDVAKSHTCWGNWLAQSIHQMLPGMLRRILDWLDVATARPAKGGSNPNMWILPQGIGSAYLPSQFPENNFHLVKTLDEIYIYIYISSSDKIRLKPTKGILKQMEEKLAFCRRIMRNDTAVLQGEVEIDGTDPT